jgi:hypothetical protein
VRTLCIPLELSSILGSGATKLVPLMLMSDLILEIELNPFLVMVTENVAPKFQITCVEYHAQIIEFSSDINEALSNMCRSSGLFIHGVQWKSIYSSLADSTKNIIVSERLKSIKSLFLSFHLPYDNLTNKRNTARHPNSLISYQVRFGSEYVPVFPISATDATSTHNGEFYVECLKAISRYSDSNHTGVLNTENFASVQNVADRCGKAVYAIDCDCFGSEQCESGMNSIENSPIDIRWTNTTNAKMDSYVHLMFDTILCISPDGNVTVSR